MTTMVCPRSELAPFANTSGHRLIRDSYDEPDTRRCYRCHITVAPSIYGDGPCRECGKPMKPVKGRYWHCTCGWPAS